MKYTYDDLRGFLLFLKAEVFYLYGEDEIYKKIQEFFDKEHE